MTNDNNHDDYEDHDEGPRYQPHGDIPNMGLSTSLKRLHFMGSDMFMRQQLTNLDLVDQFLTDLELQVLRELNESEKTPVEAHFLGAQSQMWLFAAYELVRTWRQRAHGIVKLSQAGKLQQRLTELEAEDDGRPHPGRNGRIEGIKTVLASPELVDLIGRQIRAVHIPFKRLEFLRVSLAKHEVSGRERAAAYFPGYGRINMYCGSLDYELENGKYSMGFINRRDIADELRHLDLDSEPPDDDELAGFDSFMAGEA
jgi:uncharacterized sporulation protein YeaH/YhbH (DUF444 family)